jgi:hypothetical protein
VDHYDVDIPSRGVAAKTQHHRLGAASNIRLDEVSYAHSRNPNKSQHAY